MSRMSSVLQECVTLEFKTQLLYVTHELCHTRVVSRTSYVTHELCHAQVMSRTSYFMQECVKMEFKLNC